MGQMIGYKCDGCSHQFEWMVGPNMMGYIYHCDHCGREILVEWDDTLGDDRCDCGGTIMKDVRPFCPKCRGSNLSETGTLANTD